jgi:hypothetical protein
MPRAGGAVAGGWSYSEHDPMINEVRILEISLSAHRHIR